MILPTKHILVRDSLLGVGADLLRHLPEPCSVSDLWKRVHKIQDMTYQRFVMAMDVLFIIGAIDLIDGKVGRMSCFMR